MHEVPAACPCCGLKLAVKLVPRADDSPAPWSGWRKEVIQRIHDDLSGALWKAIEAETMALAHWTVIVDHGPDCGHEHYSGQRGISPILDYEAWARVMPAATSAIGQALARHFSEARWTLVLRGKWEQEPIVTRGSVGTATAGGRA